MAPRARKSAAAAESPKKVTKEWAIKKVDGQSLLSLSVSPSNPESGRVLTTRLFPPAEPLLRADIQANVLDLIFQDRVFQYTAPVDSGQSSSWPTPLGGTLNPRTRTRRLASRPAHLPQL